MRVLVWSSAIAFGLLAGLVLLLMLYVHVRAALEAAAFMRRCLVAINDINDGQRLPLRNVVRVWWSWVWDPPRMVNIRGRGPIWFDVTHDR